MPANLHLHSDLPNLMFTKYTAYTVCPQIHVAELLIDTTLISLSIAHFKLLYESVAAVNGYYMLVTCYNLFM